MDKFAQYVWVEWREAASGDVQPRETNSLTVFYNSAGNNPAFSQKLVLAMAHIDNSGSSTLHTLKREGLEESADIVFAPIGEGKVTLRKNPKDSVEYAATLCDGEGEFARVSLKFRFAGSPQQLTLTRTWETGTPGERYNSAQDFVLIS